MKRRTFLAALALPALLAAAPTAFAKKELRRGQWFYKGTVKFFNVRKGFGFITCDTVGTNNWLKVGDEVFVHVSGTYENIREGDKVNFDLARGKKGINAVNVKLDR